MAKKAATPRMEKPGNQEAEAVYTAEEFALSAKEVFGYGRDIVRAALEQSKTTSCTIAQARRIVKEFAERKVD